jgi:heat shock protein HtpX
MSQGASFKDYSKAYTAVTNTSSVVPAGAVGLKENVELRQADVRATKQEKREQQMHQVGDIMRKVNQFVFLTCACGLKLKVPPNFKGDKVKCPRCRKVLDIPPK